MCIFFGLWVKCSTHHYKPGQTIDQDITITLTITNSFNRKINNPSCIESNSACLLLSIVVVEEWSWGANEESLMTSTLLDQH